MENIVPLLQVPSKVQAEKIIKELTARGEITWSVHCKERMKQRDITMPQIINCLLKGTVTEIPFYSHENGGGYETRVEKGTAGEWLRVVVCLKFSQKLLIVTAIN